MAEPRLEPLSAKEAIAFYRSKGLIESFSWEDVSAEEHAVAFTVAKATRRDVLQDIREAVDQALERGETFDTFRRRLRPLLEEKGWWGRQVMTDPQDGEAREVQLGSTRRLRTIFDVNLRQAFAAGRWERIEATKGAFPFLRYMAVGGKTGDGRTRPQHREWHGTILPVDHPWWGTHYPPCDFGCRCTAEQVNQRMIDRRGWEVTSEPVKFPPRTYVNRRSGEVTILESGIGPGFAYNPGKARLAGVTPKISEVEARAAELVRGGAPEIVPRPGPARLAAGADESPAETIDRARTAFSARFGLRPGEARIFRDAGGEPLPIGPALFETAGGQAYDLPRVKLAELPLVAEALFDPDEIRWVWTGETSPRLVRRYVRRLVSAGDVVDLVVDLAAGGSGPSWSWTSSLGQALTLTAYRVGVLAFRRPADMEPPSQLPPIGR